VSRGVDDVDLLALPERRHGGRLDGDTALLLLLEVVSGRRRLQILGVMDVDDRVLAPRVIEDALGRRRLAGVDVGDDADIADIGEGCCTGHSRIPWQFKVWVKSKSVWCCCAPKRRQHPVNNPEF
jgi:hypothetical protein